MRIAAMSANAADEALDVSRPLARRPHRPSHANVRSTTQRRGSTLTPRALSDHFSISADHLPMLATADRPASLADQAALPVPILRPPCPMDNAILADYAPSGQYQLILPFAPSLHNEARTATL